MDERLVALELLPIFRSEALLRVLGELHTSPAQDHTIGALVASTGVPQATVSREVAHLERAGLVQTRKDGRRTLVRAIVAGPIQSQVARLVQTIYGAPALLRQRLASLEGVDEAFIYGSWAARLLGQDGPAPQDLDLMVIGDVDAGELWALCADLDTVLGAEINPTIRSRSEWNDERTGFADDVRMGPRVDVTPIPQTEHSPTDG